MTLLDELRSNALSTLECEAAASGRRIGQLVVAPDPHGLTLRFDLDDTLTTVHIGMRARDASRDCGAFASEIVRSVRYVMRPQRG